MASRKPETSADMPTKDIFQLLHKEASKQFKTNPGAVLDDYTSGNPKIWYSTGIPTLDLALGGGLAGSMVSMFGGKTY